jgi:hypothetical protein
MTLNELLELDESVDTLSDFPYLLIEIDSDLLASTGLKIDEASRWTQSAVKGLVYRIDPERLELRQKRHVHVASQKHTSAKNKQVSWNDDGSRHDRHSFNDKLGRQVDYRNVARAALGLSASTILEAVQPSRAATLMEEIGGLGRFDLPLKFRVKVPSVPVRTILDEKVELGLPDHEHG